MKPRITWDKHGSPMYGYEYLARGPMRATKKQALEDVAALKQLHSDLQKYKEAFFAAKCFIDAHVADPDLTVEMCEAYEGYQKALRGLVE